MSRTETMAAVTRTVTSPSAFLQFNGSTIETVGGLQSKNSLLAVAQTDVIRFNEVFTLSADLARRIAKSPAGSYRIVRTFTDDNQIFITGAVQLSATAGNTGSLSMRRIDLSFENEARTETIYQGEVLRAIADISFRNNGLLKGEWRIIDPASSLGTIGGRVIQVVRKPLISSGQGRTRIISPALPTDEHGLYLVAFVVDSDESVLDIPVLRYFVLDKNHNNHATHPLNIRTLSPENGINLTDKTVFSWQKIDGAQAYQLELFNKGDDIAISGKLVPSSIAQLSLSSFSRAQLLSGYEYHWQVRAFDNKGNVIGQSESKIVVMPE